MISDEEKLLVKHLYAYKNTSEFKKDMDYLLKHYAPVDLFDILGFVKYGRPLPEAAFLLTFDDGFREMYDVVAPILLEKGISATFFVNSAFIDNKHLCYLNKASLLADHFQKHWSSSLEVSLSRMLDANGIRFGDITAGILSIEYRQRDLLDEMAKLMDMDVNAYLLSNKPYLSSEQINKLKKSGFTIGSHSIDHPLFSSLSLEDQLYQAVESVKSIRESFQLDYGVFAFPHGDNNVSREFFIRLASSGFVDLSFGTSGLVDDEISTNLQRFSLEKPIAGADRIVAFQHSKRLFRRVTRRTAEIRT